MTDFFSTFQCLDLTHCVSEDVPSWNCGSGFVIYTEMDYPKGARVMRYEMAAGIGTHMDAPAHFFKGYKTIAEICAETFFVKACVMDVSQQVKSDDYLVSIQDIADWEAKNGEIEKGCLFLVYTGWSKRWPDVKSYRNADRFGKMHFPGIDTKVAGLLLQKDVVGVGIDTLSPDGSNYQFPFHKKILGANKYLVENVASLDKMPAIGAYVLVLPMKIKGGTESPVRMLGFVPKNL